jgi:hypothetical protein
VEGGGSKVFGHLHVVFRDWQYVDSTAQSVKDDIFKDERSADTDARLRNAIRSDIKNSFQSITVWLFPPPVASASDLATKLKVGNTSEAFKTQLKALRIQLANQLSEPMKFAGKPFTGKTIGPLIEQIVESLNSGEAVRPQSAYTNMVTLHSHIYLYYNTAYVDDNMNIQMFPWVHFCGCVVTSRGG